MALLSELWDETSLSVTIVVIEAWLLSLPISQAINRILQLNQHLPDRLIARRQNLIKHRLMTRQNLY
jgi:hypothetical protein